MRYQLRPLVFEAMEISSPIVLGDGDSAVSGDAGDWLLRFEDGSHAVLGPMLFERLAVPREVGPAPLPVDDDDEAHAFHAMDLGAHFGATIADGQQAATVIRESGGGTPSEPPAWPFPWPKPRNHSDPDGPPAGLAFVRFAIAGISFHVSGTGEYVIHAGRCRYRVECDTCEEAGRGIPLIDPGTTSASATILDHLRNWHGTTINV